MVDTISLKEYIFHNNKVEYILESIGCHHVKYHPHKEFYSCGNYNGDNTGAINVKNNRYLNVVNWTRQQDFDDNSDIFDLVQYNKQCSFIEAVKYLHTLLGLEYKPQAKKENKTKKFDPLAIFKKVKMAKKRVDVEDIHAIDEEVLNDYVPLLHIDWLRDGIIEKTRKKFGLAYSYRRKRVIIPHKYWLTGELIGINSRTTLENYNEFGIRKYCLTEGYNKSLNVYGYWENHNDIERLGYCVLYESEKSVLKRDSLNDSSGLALSGKSISDEQRRIILSLNINEIVIAFDKDVAIEEIYHTCEKFYRFRKVSFIQDSWDLLGEKDSPADARSKIYNFLFKYRTVYGEEQHKQYLQSLQR